MMSADKIHKTKYMKWSSGKLFNSSSDLLLKLYPTRVCNPGLTEPENPGNPDFFRTRNPGLNGLPNPGFRGFSILHVLLYRYLRQFMSKLI